MRAAQIHGTGLGLPLSQSLAEAMNGRLRSIVFQVTAAPFTLHLPCVEQIRACARRMPDFDLARTS